MTETKLSAGNAVKKGSKSTAQKPAKPLTKVIVRCLPPTMKEETFLEQIQPIPDHDHKYFMPADWSLGVHATSRAYFNFLTQEDVFIFKEKFDGYVFVDEKGNEYPAVVEFAPYQRMGRLKSKKIDRKANTYEKNENFLDFLATMDSEETIPKLELKIDFENKHDNQIRSTPLLEYLNDKSHHKKRDRDRERKPQKILAPIREDGGNKKSSSVKESSKTSVEKSSGKKERPERSEKEKTRRAERDKMRREKRQQAFEEKKKERQVLKQPKLESTSSDQQPGTSKRSEEKAKEPLPTEKPKRPTSGAAKEVKKYSERRQDSRKKSTTTDSPASKGHSNEEESTAGTVQGSSKSASNKKSEKQDNEKGEKKESRRYSERRSNEEKRRIRNKDRPAIQIYQPGKRGSKEDGVGSSKQQEPGTPPAPETKE